MKHLKDFRLLTAGLLVVVLMATLRVEPAGAATVTPTPVDDNPTCATLAPGRTELKVEPVANGTYTDGTLSVTIVVRDTATGPVVDFTSNIGVDAVFVKGGPSGNLYQYDPPGPETTADTDLHAQVNSQNDKYYGLSHLSFCYDYESPTNTPTDTPTNTPVPPTNTPTDTPTNTPVPPTNTPTDTPTNTPVAPTNTPTDTPTNTPVVPTNTPTDTPTYTPTPKTTNEPPTPTATATYTPTPKVTNEPPTPTATATGTVEPPTGLNPGSEPGAQSGKVFLPLVVK